MKRFSSQNIKNLLALTLVYICLMNHSNAQYKFSNARYLHVYNSTLLNKQIVEIDSLYITKLISDSSFYFMVRHGNTSLFSPFLKDGPLIFFNDILSGCLMYNYNLNEGDTFILYCSDPEKLIVDSIRFRTLEQGLQYKHWYLHSENNLLRLAPDVIWIENMGEKNLGWNYSSFQVKNNRQLVSVCNDSNGLVYWDFKQVLINEPAKTCDFDSIRKTASIDKLSLSELYIFPNPTNEILQLNIYSNVTFRITDSTGKVLMNGYTSGSIDISELAAGFYYLNINADNKLFVKRFVKGY